MVSTETPRYKQPVSKRTSALILLNTLQHELVTGEVGVAKVKLDLLEDFALYFHSHFRVETPCRGLIAECGTTVSVVRIRSNSENGKS
jgi:hypothetical protein